MKLLITGGSGFLGGRAARYFGERYRVLAPTHGALELTDPSAVQSFLERESPDLVLHCAAVSDTGTCEREPECSRAINVDGAVYVAKAAGAIGAKCVLCSSDQVYFGGTQQSAHREDELLTPKNCYGRQKLEAEERCLAENPDCVLLRLSWMYDTRTIREGEHGDFLRNLLPRLRAGEGLSFPVFDRRGITDVNEVIRNLEGGFRLSGGVWNFGAPNDCSTYELMERVFARLHLSPSLLERNEQAFADGPRNLCMDMSRTAEAGIPFASTEEGLVRALKAVL